MMGVLCASKDAPAFVCGLPLTLSAGAKALSPLPARPRFVRAYMTPGGSDGFPVDVLQPRSVASVDR